MIALKTTLHILLNSATPTILFWGADSACFFNNAFLAGLPHPARLSYQPGRPGRELWAEGWHHIKRLLDRALAGEHIEGPNLPLPILPNGHHTPSSWPFRGHALMDDSGTPAGVLISCVEPSWQATQKAYQMLGDSEKKFRDLVLEAPVGITVFRGKTFIVEIANQAYLQIVDKNESDFVGKPLFDSLPELKDVIGTLLTGVLTSGRPVHGYEFPIPINRYGRIEVAYFNFVYQPIHENGAIDRIIVVANEVSESVKAKHQLSESVLERTSALEESNQQLERSNEDLQQFAHVASHDLKEPVRKIKTFSHKLQDDFKDVLDERGNLYLNKIISSTNRMYSMIDGVLNYASVTATQQPLERIDLNTIIGNIATDLEVLIQEKRATLLYRDLPTIEGMSALIHQLFYNLINNSLKFSKTDTDAQITIENQFVIHESRKFAKLTVRDNGIGFDNQYAESIFTTFTRLNSKDRYEGTGLGLALCKKIVLRHQGTISAQGATDKGAEFTILLPLIHTPI